MWPLCSLRCRLVRFSFRSVPPSTAYVHRHLPAPTYATRPSDWHAIGNNLVKREFESMKRCHQEAYAVVAAEMQALDVAVVEPLNLPEVGGGSIMHESATARRKRTISNARAPQVPSPQRLPLTPSYASWLSLSTSARACPRVCCPSRPLWRVGQCAPQNFLRPSSACCRPTASAACPCRRDCRLPPCSSVFPRVRRARSRVHRLGALSCN